MVNNFFFNLDIWLQQSKPTLNVAKSKCVLYLGQPISNVTDITSSFNNQGLLHTDTQKFRGVRFHKHVMAQTCRHAHNEIKVVGCYFELSSHSIMAEKENILLCAVLLPLVQCDAGVGNY